MHQAFPGYSLSARIKEGSPLLHRPQKQLAAGGVGIMGPGDVKASAAKWWCDFLWQCWPKAKCLVCCKRHSCILSDELLEHALPLRNQRVVSCNSAQPRPQSVWTNYSQGQASAQRFAFKRHRLLLLLLLCNLETEYSLERCLLVPS